MDKRKRILKMVEEGKLTVDEALTLLEGLDRQSETVEQTETVSSHVDRDGEKKENTSQQQSYQQFHSTKDKFFDFVDSAWKKIKDLDLDLNFGKSIEVSHIFQQSDANVKLLDIDVANGDVSIAPWDQKDVRIECKAQVYRGQTQEEAKQHFLKDVTFEIREDRLFFLTGQKWIKLETIIYVPEALYEYAEIRLFNGKIKGKDLTVNKIKAKTANGKISFEGLKGQEMETETVNGAIYLYNCEMDEVDGETLNGAIKLDGVFRKAELQSFNGNIDLIVHGDSCEIIDLQATTGGINVTIPENVPVNGELKTNLGHCKVDLTGIQVVEEKSDIIQKSLTFRALDDSSEALRIHADTKTGSIHVQKA